LPDILDFSDALVAATEIHGSRRLLLGNGFSIACRPDCFTYRRLLDEADLSNLSVDGHGLFDAEETTDFEEIINSLRVAARMATFYETSDADLAARLLQDADVVKDALAVTLARNHPDNVSEIQPAEYAAARHFLGHFDRIFTVNYDLLLYWTLMQEMEPEITSDDGFRQDHDEPEADWVSWNPYIGGARGQNVHYLHGGLHLFEEGPTLKKLTFSRTGVALIDQIRDALDREAYPLVVTEGTSTEKHARIRHSDYLSRGLRSLVACSGSIFVHGHSLADNDAHVLRAIGEGKFKGAFVGVHGNPDTPENLETVRRAEVLARTRPEGNPLAVHFYDADSASVWETDDSGPN
jgi:hypothetical protein